MAARAAPNGPALRLADVLKDAKPKSSAIYTSHYSADLHLSGDASKPPISRGVRLEKAMEPHTLIVWGMNGQPLPNIHGGPVRLVVPGWAGSASQKWLTRITLIDKEHDGPGMTEFSYRVPIKPMIPGDKGDPKNFTHSRIDAGALDRHRRRRTAPRSRPAPRSCSCAAPPGPAISR